MFFIAALLAFNASATTIDITFTATDGLGTVGSDTISALPGDTLSATVSLTADSAGVSSYGISLLFDTDFGDELNLISVTELLTAPFAFNLNVGCRSAQESTGSQAGNVLTCEAGTFGAGPALSTVDIIDLVFLVTANVATDGSDIEIGLFNTGFDGVFDNGVSALSVIPIFGQAAVNLRVPEPSTGLLVGLGLLGFALRSRKRNP
ncbi:MAG: PEP-CTERM sorting domain-containing protein [Myxococcota bacterium]